MVNFPHCDGKGNRKENERNFLCRERKKIFYYPPVKDEVGTGKGFLAATGMGIKTFCPYQIHCHP